MAGDVSHFNIRIAVDSKTGEAQIVKFGKEGKRAVNEIEQASKSAGSSFLSFSNIIKTAGVAAFAALGASAVKGAAELENYGTQFEVLTGSAEKGAALFKQIREFGAATPFETKDLAAATQTMLGFNIAQEQVMGNLQMLGDVAGGNAEKLSSLTLAFSQTSSAGKLTGGDLLQMINAGFNPLAEISRTTGKSIAELRKEMEKGAISADMVRDAFKSATGEGGKFNGMMEKQSATFSGLLSTLQDTVGMLLAEAGQPFLALLKELMPVVTPIIEGLKTFLMPLFNQLAATLKAIIPPFMVLIEKIFKALAPVLDVIVLALGKLTPIFGKIITVASRVIEAMQPMIDVFTELAEEQLDQLVELLDVLLDLFIALTPALILVSKASATLMGLQMKFINFVVTPIINAIKYIIEKGAQAIGFVNAIFGGGGKKGGAAGGTYAGAGPAGAGAGAVVTDLSGGGGAPTGGTAGPVPGSEPWYEMQIKKLEELRNKTKAGSEEWARYTLQIAAAQAKLDTFSAIANGLIGEGPEAKGISPFAQLAIDVQMLPDVVVPAVDATTTVMEELAASIEGIGQSAQYIMGQLADVFGENFENAKIFAIANSVINTAQAITSALSWGGPAGPYLATAIGVLGAAQIAKIQATEPGSGGGSSAPSGLAQSGSAPTRSGMMPRRLNLSGASGGQFPTEIKLVADGDSLVGVLQVNTRNRELAGV